MSPSDWHALRRADHEARELARREFERPLALEAGAGTGKTATLVQRIVAWCLGPGWQRHREAGEGLPRAVLGGLVAITFTEAAAAEMSERVAQAFGALANGAAPVGLTAGGLAAELGLDPEELQRRARALEDGIDHLQLTTIHGFASQLLQRHALEAGLHPKPVIDADGEALRRAAREELEARVETAYGEPADPDWIRLAQEGIGPAEIEAELRRLVPAGAQAADLDFDPLSPARFAAFRRAWLAPLEELLPPLTALLPSLKRSKKGHEIHAMGAAAQALLERLGNEPEACLEALRGIAGLEKAIKNLGEWARGEFAKEQRFEHPERIAELAGQLRAMAKAALAFEPGVLRAAQAVLAPLIACTRLSLDRRGILSFDDLLSRAVALFEHQPALLARERRRIDQLLVDEFQDTDQRQCRLVTALALEGDPAERPGLFVVGDPKQSIYAWRQADLAAYEGFLEALVRAGGIRAALVVNYRSSEAILLEVEAAIGAAMLPVRGIQPAFMPLVTPENGPAAQTQAPGQRAAVAYWVDAPDPEPVSAKAASGSAPAADPAAPERLSRGERTRREAAAFAAEARALASEGGAKYGEMALLLRAATDQELYLEALRQAGVPYVVTRDRSYYRRREVIDAAAWVRLILDPTDQVALITWLRSPAVGVPDAALLPLWNLRLPEVTQELAGALDEPQRRRLERLLAAARRDTPEAPGQARIPGWVDSLEGGLLGLAELRAAVERLPSDRFVEQLRRTSLAEIGESTRFLGHFARANLERFFLQLESQLEASDGDLEHLLGALKDQITLSREAEEARPRTQDQDALQVMTIHKAKGLDFKVVFLGQTYKDLSRGRNSATAADLIPTPEGLELCLFGQRSLLYDRAREARQERERAEWVRLLYVAMTRAKARLVVGCEQPWKQPEAGDPGAAKNLEALLSLRGHWPEPPLPGVPRELAPGVRLEVPPPPAVERALARDPSRRATPLPDPGLRSRADDGPAKQHAARPLVATASSDGHRERQEAARDQRVEPDPQERQAEAEHSAASRAALAVGSQLHALLERHRAGDRQSGRFEARGRELIAHLERELDRPAFLLAKDRAAELLEALQRGPLLERLEALEAAVVARELPVLAPSDETDGPGRPLGLFTGTIDLLYADQGRLVIADFKTDHLKDPESAARQATRYRPQLERYARALCGALGRTRDRITLELWWLETGTIETLA